MPAKNLDRAVKFYGEILAIELQFMDNPQMKMAFFPTRDQGVRGCVTHGNENKPNSEGTLVYLNGGEDLGTALSKVQAAGGSVIMPKTSIGENRYMAIFLDTEGNRVALHSMS
ncbi:MAG: VOC family protein [Saprospiraceae bacterium]|nr:VOC family protein [Saprospiraceae bacterium]